MLNGAKLLQDKLVSVLGTDLTVQSDLNPFWHTGNPCSQAGDDDLLRTRPWKHLWNVAGGAANGKGAPLSSAMRKAERYEDHVAKFISSGNGGHMWPAGGA